MVYIYTAVFELQEDGVSYYAKVPDVPGCVTTGKDLADALEQITDALSGCLVVAEDEGLEIAKPTAQCDIPVPAGGSRSFVKVDTIAYRAMTDTRSSRKNVSLPVWMINLADKYNINCSQLLQESLRNVFENMSKKAAYA